MRKQRKLQLKKWKIDETWLKTKKKKENEKKKPKIKWTCKDSYRPTSRANLRERE